MAVMPRAARPCGTNSARTRPLFARAALKTPAYPEKLAAEAIAAFGKVDALVNNAALTIRGRITETDAPFLTA
jgi:NAD(P)-dependent dehydrogenase (short-subunit alcohol dehydrogenase family)